VRRRDMLVGREAGTTISRMNKVNGCDYRVVV
jgi:hypothetical protein